MSAMALKKTRASSSLLCCSRRPLAEEALTRCSVHEAVPVVRPTSTQWLVLTEKPQQESRASHALQHDSRLP